MFVNDPDGRLLIVSCGAALHHARVAVAVRGHALRIGYAPEGRPPAAQRRRFNDVID